MTRIDLQLGQAHLDLSRVYLIEFGEISVGAN